MDRGVFVNRTEAEGTTLAEALKRYLREITPSKKGASKEASRIGAWIKHPIASRSLASLKGADFARYRDERIQSGASSGTVLRDLSIVSHLFTVAATDWGMAVLNPLNNVRKPKPGKARTRRLEGDEEERLLKACKGSRNALLYPLVVVAIETGMRLSELLGLTWGDVDLTKQLAYLADTKNGDSRTESPRSR
jgi:integrase